MEPEDPDNWHVAVPPSDAGASNGPMDEFWDDEELREDAGQDRDPDPPGHPLPEDSVRRSPVTPPGRGGHQVLLTAAVAITAAAIGVAVGLAFLRLPLRSASASPSASTPSASASPGASGGRSGGLPAPAPITGNGNGTLQMYLVGPVLAVSGNSITIGGFGEPVTAAITAATKFTGSVRTVSGIKTGTEVAAAVTGTGSKLTATQIQDPYTAT
jgi:hypothetical protein